ncbi:MAG: hypothetical protein AB8F94_14970 [Saprospiraceae bacterium]
MNKLYTLLIFALFVGMGSSNAQSTSIKSIEKSAEKAMENKDFYSAWQFYKMTTTQRSIKKDSSKLAKQMYNLGESARQFKAYDVARNAYEMVLSSKTKADYPLAEFWLARVYHSQGEYDKAVSHYSKFAKEAGQTSKNGTVNVKQEYAAVAKSAIQNCNWAKEQREFTGFKMDSLKSVNTAGTEFAPLEHNSSMYYSALEYDKENFCPDPNSEVTRLYTSDYAGEGGATSPINWAKDEKGTFVAHTAFSTDGDRMYFTLCKRINAAEFECEIYYRDKSSGMYGDAIRLSEEVNLTGTTSTQPNIGVGYDENGLEKELLFFVSNRADSLGGANSDMNIYCSFIDSMGQASTPWKININTPEDDVTPFFNNANKTLYFSSRGYQGFGGYDIYQAEQKEKENKFAQPLALEKPINSSYDDYYFSSDDEMETLYFSTNRLGVTYEDEGLETCCDDIYKLEIIKVKLEVTTFNTLTGEEGLDSCEVALYDVTNPNNPILVGEKKLDPNGNFYEFPLELEKDYRVESVRGKRWTNDNAEFTTKNLTASETIKKQLYHTPDIEWKVYAFSKFRMGESSEYLTRDLNGGTFTVNSEASVEEDNLFEMDLEFGKEYNLVVSKIGYTADGNTNEVSRNTTPYTTPTTLIDTVYLLDEYIPLGVEAKVYFHNDKPFRTDGRRSENKRITNEKYIKLYDTYVDESGMVKTYIDKNKKYGGQNEEEVLSFFRDSVTVGKKQLDLFIDYLELLVTDYKGSNDYYFEITINGYTSPRATKAYNDNLAYRRIYSINNYIKEKGSPALRAALPKDANDRSLNNDNLFIFKLVSIGEKPDEDASLEVIKSIPDNGELSVYGINASRRRKVVVKTIERKLKPISR